MTRFIGITGYVGAGKDTLGLLLAEELDCMVDSFAAPMREIAQRMGFDLINRKNKEWPVKLYGDQGEKLQNTIAEVMGYLSDNVQAELYAYTIDLMEPCWQGYDYSAPHYYISPRQFLQFLGQAGRKVDSDFWIASLLSRSEGKDDVVITDVRYPEEEKIVDELVYIHRDGCGPVNGHESEQHYTYLQSKATIEIYNNGSIADLKDAAEAIKGIIND